MELVEHGLLMSGGGFHVRDTDPEIEKIFPLAEWIAHQTRTGGHVYRRQIVVLQDWHEITEAEAETWDEQIERRLGAIEQQLAELPPQRRAPDA